MYEALLKSTPEYQKIAESLHTPGPAALFGLLRGRTVLPHGPVLVAVTVALGGLLHA